MDKFLKNKALLAGVVLSMFFAFVSVFAFYFLSYSSMEPLFYNISTEDAAKIVEKLKENKIDYRLENGGKTILVNSDNVNEIRVMLASFGLPSQSGVGFEIFDKTKFGISGFSEKVNYRRALEGELSRTIASIEGVKAARVHLAIPEPNIFVSNTKAASASVIVHLMKGFKLSDSQIKGIINLVAGAVEGLSSENISITDGEGRLIKSSGEESDYSFVENFKMSVERNISSKLQNILDKIYGAGNTIVSSSVEIDLDKIESVKEIYNPKAVLTSSTTTNEEETKGDLRTKKNSSDMKYVTDKTIEKYIKKPGNIKKLSISVAVNKTIKDAELNNIRDLISGASGIDLSRGDIININYFEFSKPKEEIVEKDEFLIWKKDLEKKQFIRDIIKYSSIIISAIMLALSMFMISKKLFSQSLGDNVVKVENKLNNLAGSLSPNISSNISNNLDQTKDNQEKEKKSKEQDRDIRSDLISIVSKDTKSVSKLLEDYISSQSKGKEVLSGSR